VVVDSMMRSLDTFLGFAPRDKDIAHWFIAYYLSITFVSSMQ